jgi:hypothetical protein
MIRKIQYKKYSLKINGELKIINKTAMVVMFERKMS